MEAVLVLDEGTKVSACRRTAHSSATPLRVRKIGAILNAFSAIIAVPSISGGAAEYWSFGCISVMLPTIFYLL